MELTPDREPPDVTAYTLALAEKMIEEAGFTAVVRSIHPPGEADSGKDGYRVVRQKNLPDMPGNKVEIIVVSDPVKKGVK